MDLLTEENKAALAEIALEIRKRALAENRGRRAVQDFAEAVQILHENIYAANGICVGIPEQYCSELNRIALKISPI